MSVCVTKPLLFTIVTRGLGVVFTLGKGSSSSKVGKLVGKITKKSETQKIIIKIRVTLHDNTETLHVTTAWCWPDLQVAGATHGHPHAGGLLLQHAPTSPGSRHSLPTLAALAALAIQAILTIVEAILTIEAIYPILTIEASWWTRRRIVETEQILTLYVDITR